MIDHRVAVMALIMPRTSRFNGVLPRYHITAERNWLNDPNGPIQWQGRYHLFFQTNPDAPGFGAMRWGHVSSGDLVTWQRHPLALEPSDGPDRDGCWSGCARVVDGEPSLYYTGIVHDGDRRIESICRAIGSPDLLQWTKDPANPLVAGPPPSLERGDHRDPFLWQDNDGWHLIVATGAEGHGQTLVYHSPDAHTWSYGGVFFESPRYVDGVDVGDVWECPALVRFEDADVLILSVIGPTGPRTLYFVGRVISGRFEGEYGDRLDHGSVFYAPTTMIDESGRQLLWAWIQEETTTELPRVGALSLPRVLDLVDGKLRMTPAPELTALRVGETTDTAAQMEIAARPTSGVSTWSIGSIPIVVDLDNYWLTVGSMRAAIVDQTDTELQIFVDGSIVEVFLGGQATITARRYDDGAVVADADCTMWRLRSTVD